MSISATQLRARAKKIKLLLTDVDGVMTDGAIYYHPSQGGGFYETKGFHARDGLAIRFAREAGLKTGIISGRASPIVEHRAKELKMDFIEQGVYEKRIPYERILEVTGLRDEEVCFVGDDVVDLPVLIRVGLAVSVANSDKSLNGHVHYTTAAIGGRGAVREVVEIILEAQGKWDAVMNHFLA